MDTGRIAETLEHARAALLEQRSAVGSWPGRLSSSALATATAACALALGVRAARIRGEAAEVHTDLAAAGRAWLCCHQNEDGGWGDTTDSPSNISTTTLTWACLGLDAHPAPQVSGALARAEIWIQAQVGTLTPAALARRVRESYGSDHTFSIPILTTCAVAGRLGPGREGWRLVPSLPFELAACPHAWFRLLGLRMVSYALPALIAIGQVGHHHRPSRNPLARLLRNLTSQRTLRILEQIQPAGGGYLEATPLTSFVALSLISMGLEQHPVVRRSLDFLVRSQRPDGSWPIDTNLNTWLSTLCTDALAGTSWDEADRSLTRTWLLDQQYRVLHPYTHAAPGGWAWTDLSGGVPDADDTAGALLALKELATDPADEQHQALQEAVELGVGWLLDLQNRDGGLPTFCRGWGKLPFDRSAPDLTAHALRAFSAWRQHLPLALRRRAERAQARGVDHLVKSQRADGTWVPLWFGNQGEADGKNPLYGTSRVLRAVSEVRCQGSRQEAWVAAGTRAVRWLLAIQGSNGGFGAARNLTPSVEETALAVEALATWHLAQQVAGADPQQAEVRCAVSKGSDWLVAQTRLGTHFPPAPIGLYFAKLWYSEKLYPLIFTVSALKQACRCLQATSEENRTRVC